MSGPSPAGIADPLEPTGPSGPAAVPPTVLWLVGLGAVAGVAYLYRDLVLPLLLAVLLAYLLNPVAAWAQGFGIRRGVAVALVFAGLALALVGSAYVLAPRVRAEGTALIEHLPPLVERGIREAVREVTEAYPRLSRVLAAVPDRDGWIEDAVHEQLGQAAVVAHAGILVFVGILTPIFSFFLLRDGGRIVRFVLDRIHPRHIETSVAVWSEIDQIIGRYLRGLALDGLAVGILAGLGLWLVGVPYPLLLGAFTGFVNPIPYLGTLLSVSMAGVVALANGHGFATIGWILVVYGVIRLLDDVLIAVVTIGGSVHLHPMLVLASIIAGEQALGVVGMVIAVPLVTVVKETVRLLVEHRRTLRRMAAPLAGPGGAPPHYVC